MSYGKEVPVAQVEYDVGVGGERRECCTPRVKVISAVVLFVLVAAGVVTFILFPRDLVVQVDSASFSQVRLALTSDFLFINGTLTPRVRNDNYLSISVKDIKLQFSKGPIEISVEAIGEKTLASGEETDVPVTVAAAIPNSGFTAFTMAVIGADCLSGPSTTMTLDGSAFVSHPLKEGLFTFTEEVVPIPC